MTDWAALRAALREMRGDGVELPFWWRDDDATTPTKALETLDNLSVSSGLPVHLAIIPANADAALADHLQTRKHMVPLVHGWAHTNHADKDQKSCEFPVADDVATERVTQAIDRLRSLFGPLLCPVFVPPWNRMDAALEPVLVKAGYKAVSTFGARGQGCALPRINTHIDPIFWRGHRDLVAPDTLIAQTVSHLKARREGREDATEPMGYLTHHLVHTPAIWAFSEQFLKEMLDGGARPVNLQEELT